MTRRFASIMLPAAAALALTGVAAGSTHKTKMNFTATLNVGQAKPTPKNTKNGASGKFTATLSGTTLTWKLTFTHLSGPATAAHIHAGKRGVSDPNPMIPLCGPCTSGQTGTVTGVTTDQIAKMKAGATYVNVHTNLNKAGEIRGQIVMAM